jgi:hypothetical protein
MKNWIVMFALLFALTVPATAEAGLFRRRGCVKAFVARACHRSHANRAPVRKVLRSVAHGVVKVVTFGRR